MNASTAAEGSASYGGRCQRCAQVYVLASGTTSPRPKAGLCLRGSSEAGLYLHVPYRPALASTLSRQSHPDQVSCGAAARHRRAGLYLHPVPSEQGLDFTFRWFGVALGGFRGHPSPGFGAVNKWAGLYLRPGWTLPSTNAATDPVELGDLNGLSVWSTGLWRPNTISSNIPFPT